MFKSYQIVLILVGIANFCSPIGGHANAAESLPVSQTPAAMAPVAIPNQKIQSAQGVTVEIKDSKLVFDSSGVLAEFKLHDGVVPDRFREKNTGVECLMTEDPLPLFMVNGLGLSISSLEFQVAEVILSEEKDGSVAEIKLALEKPALTGNLRIKMNPEGRMTWKLSVGTETKDFDRLQLVFPIIGKIRIGADLAENRFFYPQRTGIEGKSNLDITHEYGTLAWMQVMGVHSPATETRLSVYPMDSTGKFKGLRSNSTAKAWDSHTTLCGNRCAMD
jgi:hypothetical protein